MKAALKTIVSGILAGMAISFGGIAFLTIESKIVGAIFFTVGLFMVCNFGFSLFTGKVCYIVNEKGAAVGKYVLFLIESWCGNLIGAVLMALLVRATRIGSLSEKAAVICDTKLNDSLLSIFILGIFCNIMIFVAVDGFKNIKNDIGKILALFFGVTVFVICGFEHCVANMFYITMAGAWSLKALLFLLINTLGNACGGVIIPILMKVCAPAKAKE